MGGGGGFGDGDGPGTAAAWETSGEEGNFSLQSFFLSLCLT